MKPKVLIIVLVVLIVLFAVGLGGGVTRKPDPPGNLSDFLKAPLVSTIGAKLKQPLAPADIDLVNPSSWCQRAAPKVFQIEGGVPCAVTVKSSSVPVRTLALQLTQGATTDVQLRQTDRMEVDVTLNPSQAPHSFDIYKEGGLLTLQCHGVAQCQVTMGQP